MQHAIWFVVMLTFGFLTTGASAKTLTFCSEGNPETLSPIFNTTSTSFDVTGQIYDNLVSFRSGSTELEPALASRWKVSKDGLEYVFSLRQGVKWQGNASFTPTRDFNADDVVFTFERQWKPTHPYFKVTSGHHPYFNDVAMPDMLKSIEKIDSHTVKFKLNYSVTPFVANLAMRWAGMQSAEYAAAMLVAGTPERVDTEPLGTGAFQLQSFDKDVQVTFKAFDAHWAGRAKVDGLIFAIQPNAALRWTMLQEGQCQIMAYPKPADLPQMRTNPQFLVKSQTGLNIGYMAYNIRKKPFDDVRVRQALNMAIDRRKILRDAYQHTAVPATNPIPPIQWSYNRNVADDVFDPDAAKLLLAKAGYSDGFTTELWAMPVQRPYLPDAQAVAKLIQSDLAAIGVKVQIKSPDWQGYLRSLHAGEHQMALIGWTGDNGDPDNFLNTLLGCASLNGNNIAKFCNPRYDLLVKKAKSSTVQEHRIRLYEQAQVIFKEQAPWLTLAHAVQYKVMRREVVGFEVSPFGRHEFLKVDVLSSP
jgi:dipeptide transport system substrate-binding protein